MGWDGMGWDGDGLGSWCALCVEDCWRTKSFVIFKVRMAVCLFRKGMTYFRLELSSEWIVAILLHDMEKHDRWYGRLETSWKIESSCSPDGIQSLIESDLGIIVTTAYSKFISPGFSCVTDNYKELAGFPWMSVKLMFHTEHRKYNHSTPKCS